MCVTVGATLLLAACDSDSGRESGRASLPSPKWPKGSYSCLAKKASPAFHREAGERVHVMLGSGTEADTYTWYYVAAPMKGIVGPKPPC